MRKEEWRAHFGDNLTRYGISLQKMSAYIIDRQESGMEGLVRFEKVMLQHKRQQKYQDAGRVALDTFGHANHPETIIISLDSKAT